MTVARILLVEDNPVTRKAAAAMLADQGYAVVEADSAHRLREIVGRERLDLVLLDLSLPDSDGIELLPWLRSAEGMAKTPVLAFTGEGDEQRLFSAGFTDILAKPVDATRLSSAIRIHLSRGCADPPGDGRRILVVDENPTMLQLEVVRFRQLGFEVISAANGREALQRLGAGEVDVILSELLSPDMDGLELCEAVHDKRPTLPVVLASEQPLNPAERELAVRAGVSAAVLRTPDLNGLVDAVLQALVPRSYRKPPSRPSELSTEQRRQAISTLEHRASLREDLARRDGTLRAVRSILERLDDFGGRSRDQVLFGALASFLDAAGFSCGAAYVAKDDGALELCGQIGFSAERELGLPDFWGNVQLLATALDLGEPRAACASQGGGSIRQILAAAGKGSLVVIPLRHGVRRLGVLVLASSNPRLPLDWLLLSETVSGAIAHAVALADAQTRLSETEQRFHGIADSTSEGILVADADGVITYANASLLSILDLPPRVVIGRSAPDLLPFLHEGALSAQGTVQRADGRQLPLEVSVSAIDDSQTQPEGQGRPCQVFLVRDLSERLRLSEVARLASHDALTGLYNRRRFEEELQSRLSESRRYGTIGALLLLDIDHFKRVNDTYGHQAGDCVLTAVAEVLRTATRESDVPARLGGDEFVVLLPHANGAQARACATKIFERIAQLNPVYQGWSLPVAASIGVAVYPTHGDTAATLVANVDEALYTAKRRGRSQVCVRDGAEDSVPSRPSGSMRLEHRLSDSTHPASQRPLVAGG